MREINARYKLHDGLAPSVDHVDHLTHVPFERPPLRTDQRPNLEHHALGLDGEAVGHLRDGDLFHLEDVDPANPLVVVAVVAVVVVVVAVVAVVVVKVVVVKVVVVLVQP